ncbi:CFS1-like protein [Guyanagaster necrorhizus]|uniref:CFS1-like protein n=1 Tax=Guyanagaster necrorhizus TaxID=856835 RepID=A0A9P7VFK2_9AGAR|nr:CFS1-like protein [Guyanagaster necrorhizus MCA 3950]KAG7439658.1 CFS1-like protein [Guyanagaster necrorhizus MCA 3950]
MGDLPPASLSKTQVLGVIYAPSLGESYRRHMALIHRDHQLSNLGTLLGFLTLNGISTGHLTIKDGEDVHEFGPDEEPRVLLCVRSGEFWTRVALFTDLGLAESFMSSIVDCNDVSTLVKLLILNRDHLSQSLKSFASSLLARGRLLTSYNFVGNLSNSKANISAHYDIENELFSAFLGPDMTYSSAIFSKIDADLTGVPEDTLADGQMQKMKMILKKADIRPGDRVLEIGTGWGSLAILAAETIPGCKIDTITSASTQAAFARKRIKEAGLSDFITVHEMDYRECFIKPEWAGAFDRFISVEMIEHVGRDFLTEYWKVVDWAVKRDTGLGVVQVITFPEARIESYHSEGVDFMQKWFFPGGYLPTPCILMEAMKAGSSGRLTVDSIVNIGPHYARTLREWKRNFVDAWEGTISPALVRKYNLTPDEQEVFRRKWIYFVLASGYSEAGFSTRTLGDHIVTFTRDGNTSLRCEVSNCS